MNPTGELFHFCRSRVRQYAKKAGLGGLGFRKQIWGEVCSMLGLPPDDAELQKRLRHFIYRAIDCTLEEHHNPTGNLKKFFKREWYYRNITKGGRKDEGNRKRRSGQRTHTTER